MQWPGHCGRKSHAIITAGATTMHNERHTSGSSGGGYGPINTRRRTARAVTLLAPPRTNSPLRAPASAAAAALSSSVRTRSAEARAAHRQHLRRDDSPSAGRLRLICVSLSRAARAKPTPRCVLFACSASRVPFFFFALLFLAGARERERE